MSQFGNTAHKNDLFGPDRLSDPDFVSCRDENCTREGLHQAHDEPRSRSGRHAHERYDKCPKCQTTVLVTQTRRIRQGTRRSRQVNVATCPNCGWTHSKALTRTTTDA